MHTAKKTISFLLAALLCLSLLPAALASGEAETEQNRPAPADVIIEEPEEAVIEEPASDGAGGVPIDEAHFPDAVFRAEVSKDFDTDNDGSLSDEEIAEAQYIIVIDKNVASLQGIEFLTAATILYCRGNSLTSLDLSRNTALTIVDCSGNQLTSLDASGCPALEKLFCEGNRLTSLDLSRNTALKILTCDENQLTDLDVSACPLLTEIVQAGKQPPYEDRNTPTSWFYEIGDPNEMMGFGDGLWFFFDNGIEIRLIKALICDQSVTVTAGDTVIPGGSPSPTPIPLPTAAPKLGVSISRDRKSARVTGDWSGLYARVALSFDLNGQSGLVVQQAEIRDNGRIDIPSLPLPGVTLTGVNVALVPTLEDDIQSPTPDTKATDFKTLGDNAEGISSLLQSILAYLKGAIQHIPGTND